MSAGKEFLQLQSGFNPLALVPPSMTCGEIVRDREKLKAAALGKNIPPWVFIHTEDDI